MPEEQEVQQDDAAIRAEIASQVFYGDDVIQEIAPPSEETEPIVQEQIQEEDPWAGVSPALRTQFDALQAKVQDFDKKVLDFDKAAFRLKQTEQRIGSLTNEIHAAKQAAIAAPKAPTQDEIEAAAKTKQAWDELKNDFPEWQTAIDGRLAAERAEITRNMLDANAVRAEIDGKTGQTKIEIEAKIERLVEQAKLEMRHPDYEEVKESPRFTAWLNAQPQNIRETAYSSARAKDASRILDLYKESQKPTKTAGEIKAINKQRLQQSQTFPGRQSQPVKSEADMTDAEYRNHIAAQVWKKKGT